MNPIIKNVLAVGLGWIVGSLFNMGLISLGHSIFPIAGADPNDMEAMASIMADLEPKYFLLPFLAHALGTLTGAFLAARMGASKNMKLALLVGLLFLIGGILVNYMLPGPTWFAVVDIALAYIPMAWIGGRLGLR